MYIPEINTYFIHIPKTGGTSIEMFFFRNVCGFPDMQPRAIFNQLGKHGGRELAGKYHFGQPTPEPLHTGETQHLGAWQLKQWNDPSFCNAQYTFSFVRNPWDRFVSEVFWKRKEFQHMQQTTFEDEIERLKIESQQHPIKIRAPHNAQQWKFIYDENMNLLVDDVFKLEEVDKAEKVLSEKLNMEVKFGWENKINRKDYSEYLTPELKDKIYPLIKKDLETFGYE